MKKYINTISNVINIGFNIYILYLLTLSVIDLINDFSRAGLYLSLLFSIILVQALIIFLQNLNIKNLKKIIEHLNSNFQVKLNKN